MTPENAAFRQHFGGLQKQQIPESVMLPGFLLVWTHSSLPW
jgi:hypothetical protein